MVDDVLGDIEIDTRIPSRRADGANSADSPLHLTTGIGYASHKKVHRAIGRSGPSHEADWGKTHSLQGATAADNPHKTSRTHPI